MTRLDNFTLGLKKMDLGEGLDPTSLTDHVFQRVFRNLRLREFHVASISQNQPLEAVFSNI